MSASTTVTKDEIKYFVYGDFTLNDGDWTIRGGEDSFNQETYYPNSFALNVDQTNGSAIIPMYGKASINGDKLTANMQMAEMALLCLHNNSNASITVKLNLVWDAQTNETYWIGKENTIYSFNTYSNPYMKLGWYTFTQYQDENAVTATTIEAGKKAYFPILIMSGGPTGRPVRVVVNGSQYKEKELNQFAAGKIYKLNYPGQ